MDSAVSFKDSMKEALSDAISVPFETSASMSNLCRSAIATAWRSATNSAMSKLSFFRLSANVLFSGTTNRSLRKSQFETNDAGNSGFSKALVARTVIPSLPECQTAGILPASKPYAGFAAEIPNIPINHRIQEEE